MDNIKREVSFQCKNRQRDKQIGFFFANGFVELLLYQVAAVFLNSASIIRYASPNVAHNPIRGNIQMNLYFRMSEWLERV
jgi:hypothetical protein